MNYNTLLDMATELGYYLAISGAETYRVEDSVGRILNAYGLTAEVFAIPNCLTVSIDTAEGEPLTRMRRVDYQNVDLDSVERFSNLSRRICAQKPKPEVAMEWLQEVAKSRVQNPLFNSHPKKTKIINPVRICFIRFQLLGSRKQITRHNAPATAKRFTQ